MNARAHELEADPEWPADVTHDRLIGDVYLYQRRGGHRTGTDDVLTAYYATHRASGPCASYLDLGCGVGSVLLMVAHRLRPAVCVGVEAQRASFLLASRAVSDLGPGWPPLQVLQHDFRELDLGRRFALITGSPPYFPTHTGVLPQDPQRLACRFELRGGVEAYCDAAARHLSADGRFYLVHQTAFDGRVRAAAAEAGLQVHSWLDAHMREDRAEPFLSVYEMALFTPTSEPRGVSLSIRGADGQFTPGYVSARRALGVDGSGESGHAGG
ncbi:MAG: SAM-dependent methyltransferase [Myxococcales bacterium]|nr:SAM-dependent methyltransferase [Myxococcales bacterium]MCB9627217.1 SAM-dependent methyltransferase [Sandaracinaceae bacterium]